MAHPTEDRPRVHLELETVVALVSTGRMGDGVPDMAEVTFGCPNCDHSEVVMVDVVAVFAMMALHRGREHQPADALNRVKSLLGPGGTPLSRAERRKGTNGNGTT